VADTKEKRAEWKPDDMEDGEYWWRVSSPYVTVKTATTEGMRIIGLHRGGTLPLDVREEQLAHLASHGLIEAFPMSTGERAQLAADPPGGEPGPQRVDVQAEEAAAKDEGGGPAPTQAAGRQAGSTSARPGGGTSRSKAADK